MKLYYSLKTIYVLSCGWLLCPDTYKDYVNAWLIVNQNPDLAIKIIKNYDDLHINKN